MPKEEFATKKDFEGMKDEILTGISDVVQIIGQHMDERFEQVDKRFEQVDKRFEQVDQRFENIENRLDRVERKLDNTIERTDQHSELLTKLEPLLK